MERRSKPSGPRGRMSGSRKRFSRKGSTASRESGPPSWKRTIPTRFFPATLFAPVQGAFQSFDVLTQSGGAVRHGEKINEKYSPPDEISRKHAVQIFHPA